MTDNESDGAVGGAIALLGLMFVGFLAFLAPMLVGLLAGVFTPGSGGLRDLSFWGRLGWVIAAFFGAVIAERLGTRLARVALIARPRSSAAKAWVGGVVSACFGIGAMWLLLLPLYERSVGAGVAACVANLIYAAVQPWLEKRSQKKV